LAMAPELAGLPWEAMPDPAEQRPLALHPLITAYRLTRAGAAREIPGPLRIVVAIAAPDEGGGPVLDYERELRDVVAAVRGARQGPAGGRGRARPRDPAHRHLRPRRVRPPLRAARPRRSAGCDRRAGPGPPRGTAGACPVHQPAGQGASRAG